MEPGLITFAQLKHHQPPPALIAIHNRALSYPQIAMRSNEQNRQDKSSE